MGRSIREVVNYKVIQEKTLKEPADIKNLVQLNCILQVAPYRQNIQKIAIETFKMVKGFSTYRIINNFLTISI